MTGALAGMFGNIIMTWTLKLINISLTLNVFYFFVFHFVIFFVFKGSSPLMYWKIRIICYLSFSCKCSSTVNTGRFRVHQRGSWASSPRWGISLYWFVFSSTLNNPPEMRIYETNDGINRKGLACCKKDNSLFCSVCFALVCKAICTIWNFFSLDTECCLFACKIFACDHHTILTTHTSQHWHVFAMQISTVQD